LKIYLVIINKTNTRLWSRRRIGHST